MNRKQADRNPTNRAKQAKQQKQEKASSGSRTKADAATEAARTAGVLLHITSLPNAYGIGDLGPSAFQWVDALARAGQSWWQILPLGPPGMGNSPYQSYSAFAGNTDLISPAVLLREGLLNRSDLSGAGGASAGPPAGSPDAVDFARVTPFKSRLLARAWERFNAGGSAGGGASGKALRREFERFCAAEADWLDDFALFMALREASGGRHWQEWDKDLVHREPAALSAARRERADAIGRHRFGQFLFFRQLSALREHAHAKGVKLMGDLPIYVSDNSADVWAEPQLFLLDRHRRPTAVAGVPPDVFSRTGQRWGNPLYDWAAMKRDGYDWWARRLRATRRQVDLVRIDHFRGFAGFWKIPAAEPTAVNGRWVPAPGGELFDALRKKLGDLPVIAEDLGVITPDVVALRDCFNLPGMRVLQFAFGGDDSAYLPHNYVPNTVAYTGTHDNDTTAGWYASLKEKDRARVRAYVPGMDADPAGALTRLAWSSVAKYAIVPMQDVLGLGTEARMNMPGRGEGNWGWRMREEAIKGEGMERLGEMTEVYRRGTRR